MGATGRNWNPGDLKSASALPDARSTSFQSPASKCTSRSLRGESENPCPAYSPTVERFPVATSIFTTRVVAAPRSRSVA